MMPDLLKANGIAPQDPIQVPQRVESETHTASAPATRKRKALPVKEEDDEIDLDLDEEMKRKQGELKVGTVFPRHGLNHISGH